MIIGISSEMPMCIIRAVLLNIFLAPDIACSLITSTQNWFFGILLILISALTSAFDISSNIIIEIPKND
jgi:hypothetical protein